MTLFQRQSALVQQLGKRNADAIGLVQTAPPETLVPLLHSLLETEHRQIIWRWHAVRLFFLVLSTINLVIGVKALLQGEFKFPIFIAGLFLGLSKREATTSVRWKKGLSGLLYILPQVSHAQALRPLLFLTVIAHKHADLMEKGQRKWLRERLTLALGRLPSSELASLSTPECAQLVSLAVHPKTDPFLRCAVLLALADRGPAPNLHLPEKLALFVEQSHPETVQEATRECLASWSRA